MKKWILILLYLNITFAQQSAIYTHKNNSFNEAIHLFKNNQFQAAKIIFDSVYMQNNDNQTKADCAYYSAFCGLQLNVNNAEKQMENFIENYPTSTKNNQANTETAKFYFQQSNYLKAVEWFEKVDENLLTADEVETINFYKGYSFFNANKKKEASVFLNKVANSEKYGSQAKYYLGFLAYDKDDYKEATKYFDAVSGEEKYKEKLSYFQADMNFKLGKFDKAIELGKLALKNSNDFEISELNKIIGESYFNLKKYAEALPFLQNYKGKKGKWNNTDFYQLGYTYYMQNDFENAISQFNKIINGNDYVAQNGYYHLGECYIKTQKLQQALVAFKSASEMSFDDKIKEDAFLNYARLSYDLGNAFTPVPEVLNSFINQYPNSSYKIEIESYLVNALVTSKNYVEALQLLEKNKNLRIKDTYQKVLFFRGIELFTDGNYQNAYLLFKKSIEEQKNSIFLAKATFWKAETEFVLEDFEKAIESFIQFENLAEAKNCTETNTIHYNLGFAYFKVKNYEQASINFQKFTENKFTDKQRLTDANLRLADSKFVLTQYNNAIFAYKKAIDLKSIDADYAYFQIAICYGFLKQTDKKINEFDNFLKKYSKSNFRDDALLELAATFTADNQINLALTTYDQLINEFPNGNFHPKAILRQGLIYYNSDKDNLALEKFKKVVSEFPKTPEAVEAVTTARLIYVDQGKVDEYANWVKNLDFISVSNTELENDTFEAAEKQNQQGNSKQAIANYLSYITNYPNGSQFLKANFTLAQLLYADNQQQKSIPYYENVIKTATNLYTEQSLARLCELYLKNDQNVDAIITLKRLENESNFEQNKTYAQANLMRLYFEQKEYENAVKYADLVILNLKTDVKIKDDAQIILARSAWQSNNFEKAKQAYAKLQKTAKGELAAEALYYDAYFKHTENLFEVSNKIVQKLAKDYGSYKYFGAKGLIIMAKNFYNLKDSFQATFILESVIKNFTQFADVVVQAQTELQVIKKEEAKTNASITK